MIGKDPRNVEDIWTVLYRAGCYRGGPILMSAIAGIDLRAQGRRRTTAARKEVRVMKPRLLPVHLEEHPSESFRDQLGYLEGLTGELVEWLEPAHIDDQVPAGTSAVVVPDLSGRAYRMVDSFGRAELPILIITSEFGTVSMWDWEIRDQLRRRGVETIAPTSPQECEDVCRTLATKEALAGSRMLAYQDDLGAGMQPDNFKRFYWWEDECGQDLQEEFGVTVERRSFRELAARAAAVPDARVEEAWSRLSAMTPIVGLSSRGRGDALRLYVALGDELDEAGDVIAAGINCLNESATSTTTPCLAWNLLFEERGLMWGCEADLTSMITKTLVHKSLRVPVMMTNLYPFLIGQAALKHERIPYFPDVVEEPENHILVAHCGYFGVVRRRRCSRPSPSTRTPTAGTGRSCASRTATGSSSASPRTT